MAKEAAIKGDKLHGNSTTLHIWTTSAGTSMNPPCTFSATINGGVSGNVSIEGQDAATVDSFADASSAPETSVDSSAQPAAVAKATITDGSGSVSINSKAAARNGDPAKACSSGGSVVIERTTATVFIGD